MTTLQNKTLDLLLKINSINHDTTVAQLTKIENQLDSLPCSEDLTIEDKTMYTFVLSGHLSHASHHEAIDKIYGKSKGIH